MITGTFAHTFSDNAQLLLVAKVFKMNVYEV